MRYEPPELLFDEDPVLTGWSWQASCLEEDDTDAFDNPDEAEIPAQVSEDLLEAPPSRWDQIPRDSLSASLVVPANDEIEPCENLAGESSVSRPFLVSSALAHLALLLIMAIAPVLQPQGTGGEGDRAVMVRMVDPCEIMPDHESPASVDSTGSLPAVARRAHDSQPQKEPLPREKTIQLLEKSATVSKTQPEQSNSEEEEKRRTAPDERTTKEKEARKDDLVVDSESNTDSIAAVASAASPERRITSAGGKEEEYKSKVFSAIVAASYYPRKAVRDSRSGETIVEFTVHRDGSLTDLRIARHSGSEILDQAAVKIVEKAARSFPPFPEEVHAESLFYQVPIVFKKRSS